jgi:hypothetical protein
MKTRTSLFIQDSFTPRGKMFAARTGPAAWRAHHITACRVPFQHDPGFSGAGAAGWWKGLFWMCKKFQAVQVEERESVRRWQSKDYKGDRIACLSRVASAKFFELVGWPDDDAFRVENSQFSDVELVGGRGEEGGWQCTPHSHFAR